MLIRSHDFTLRCEVVVRPDRCGDLGVLGSALASSGEQQVQAVIGVQERLDRVAGLLDRMLQRIGDTRVVIQAPSALEVGTIGGGN